MHGTLTRRTPRSARSWSWVVVALLVFSPSLTRAETELDQVLDRENSDRQVQAAAKIDDLAFLRRATIDLLGRIPTDAEIQEYQAWPAAKRRTLLVEKLLSEPAFSDRWTVFLADLLRIRNRADGGEAWYGWMHKAVQDRMPYDVMVRQMITVSGKTKTTPEIGFLLGDEGRPLSLAATTSQVFMGVRIGCAECHDHPFDKWKRDEFYGFAAYFGRMSRRKTDNSFDIYIVENRNSSVQWPPEGVEGYENRKPVVPKFPFALDADEQSPHIVRLAALRKSQAVGKTPSASENIDNLLASADSLDRAAKLEEKPFDITGDAKQEARDLDVAGAVYRMSRDRMALAELITSPRNRYFSRHFANRVWSELMGRGIVMPLDDFSDTNEPTHPATLDFLADEFVAQGFDLRNLVRVIVLSDAYQRGHLPASVDAQERKASTDAFAAAVTRRMLAETLHDSIVTAGHLHEPKFKAGENLKMVKQLVKTPIKVPRGPASESVVTALSGQEPPAAKAVEKPEMIADADADKAIAAAMSDKKPAGMTGMDAMNAAMSPEQIEAEAIGGSKEFRIRFVEEWVDQQIDDNPTYSSTMQTTGPERPTHFLRIFGQTARDTLGEVRDNSPNMQQALRMLNGKLTHDAARVGTLEPLSSLLAPGAEQREAAVRLAYREILTREPVADELTDALALLETSDSPLAGIADLRWLLLNSNEFRYLP